MGALREKMIAEMKLRNFAARTQKSYLCRDGRVGQTLSSVPGSANAGTDPHLRFRVTGAGTVQQFAEREYLRAAIFLSAGFGVEPRTVFLPRRKRTWRLPEVLSPREVERLLDTAVKLRDRCLLMTAYSAGLRVDELIHLKLSDIDPERMMIRVEQGKGKKDRFTILSQRLLGELKKYKQTYQPVSWVFFGQNRNEPLHISAAQKIYNRAKHKSGIEKGKGIHTCAIVSRPISWKVAWTW
jgi:integrase